VHFTSQNVVQYVLDNLSAKTWLFLLNITELWKG